MPCAVFQMPVPGSSKWRAKKQLCLPLHTENMFIALRFLHWRTKKCSDYLPRRKEINQRWCILFLSVFIYANKIVKLITNITTECVCPFHIFTLQQELWSLDVFSEKSQKTPSGFWTVFHLWLKESSIHPFEFEENFHLFAMKDFKIKWFFRHWHIFF